MYKSICEEWRSSPSRNPITGRQLHSRENDVTKNLQRMCGKTDAELNTLVYKWLKDPLVNPITKRSISPKGSIYKLYRKMAENASTVETGKRKASPTRYSEESPRQLQAQKKLKSNNVVLESETTATIKRPYQTISVADRSEYIKAVARQEVEDIANAQQRVCLSGPASFLQVFDSTRKLASQWSMDLHAYISRYWAVTRNNLVFRMEEIPLCPHEADVVRRGGHLDLIETYRQLNTLVMHKKSPHFALSAQPRLCDGCPVKTADTAAYSCRRDTTGAPCSIGDTERERALKRARRGFGSCLIVAAEGYHNTLDKLVFLSHNKVSSEVWNVLLFQVLHALATMQRVYGMRYSLQSPKSIMIRRVAPGGYWKYKVGDVVYYLPNIGLVALIGHVNRDMVCMKPQFSKSGFYGGRNVVRTRMPSGHSSSVSRFAATTVLDPISNTMRPVSTDVERWMPHFVKGHMPRLVSVRTPGAPTPVLAVTHEKLNDTDLLPPHSFAEDVYNVICNFIGGFTVANAERKRRLPPIVRNLQLRDDTVFDRVNKLFNEAERRMVDTVMSEPLPYYYYSAEDTLRLLFADYYSEIPKSSAGQRPIDTFKL
jgi:2-cysteine adaptor domain